MYQNYITGQTSLTLNLDFSVPENHLITVISTFVHSIPDDVMLETTSDTGRPAYHPAMMLKILFFGFLNLMLIFINLLLLAFTIYKNLLFS